MEELLGCVFSNYDIRDYTLKSNKETLPEAFACNMIIPIKNQGSVSSCVAHACSSILEYHTNPYRLLSTNFIYGIQKELFNREDKGMILRDACKIIANYGSPDLPLCPGNDEVPKCHKIASTAMEDESIVANAWQYRILKYFKCKNIDDIKYAVYNYGPVLIAYKWYKDYKVKDCVLIGEQKEYSGGHALVVYGWNEVGLMVQNSWGPFWGKRGRCVIPYSIPFREAYGIVDATNEEVKNLKQPVKNSFTNLIYKAINFLVNLIRKLINKD